MTDSRGKRLARALRWLAMAALLTAATAAGASTRGQYVAKLEGVCKPKALATQRAMRGARADLSSERLGVAAGKFAKATQLFGSTVERIEAVPRPAEDAATLREWFSYLRRQQAYLERITAELRAGHAVKAQRLTARFIHNGNLANNAVLEFGFDYCSFEFSRYG